LRVLFSIKEPYRSLASNSEILSLNSDTNYFVYSLSFTEWGVILVVSEDKSGDSSSFNCREIFCLLSFDSVFYTGDFVAVLCFALDDFTSYF